MSEEKLVGTQAEYAKHRKARRLRGETESAVSQAVKSGRLQAAIRQNGLIDFAIADQLWAAGRAPQVEFGTPKPDAPANPGAAFLEAKARRETAEADMAEIKASKARAELVAVDDVRKAFTAIGRMFAAARENVPLQLAPKLVGLTDMAAIEALIRQHYREADSRVADEIQSRYSEITGSDGDSNSPGRDAHS